MDFEIPKPFPDYRPEPFYLEEMENDFALQSNLSDNRWYKNAPYVELDKPKEKANRFCFSTVDEIDSTNHMMMTGHIAAFGIVSVMDRLYNELPDATPKRAKEIMKEVDQYALLFWETEFDREEDLVRKLKNAHQKIKSLKAKIAKAKDQGDDKNELSLIQDDYAYYSRGMSKLKIEWFGLRHEMAQSLELCSKTRTLATNADGAFQLIGIMCRTFIIREACFPPILPPRDEQEMVEEIQCRSKAEDICRFILLTHGVVVTNSLLRKLWTNRENLWPGLVGQSGYELACERAIENLDRLFLCALLTDARERQRLEQEEETRFKRQGRKDNAPETPAPAKRPRTRLLAVSQQGELVEATTTWEAAR